MSNDNQTFHIRCDASINNDWKPESAQPTLLEQISCIPCICPQCDDRKWRGITSEFLNIVETGKEQLLEAEEAEWQMHIDHLGKTQRPVWTAEELAAVEDRIDRALIAASEGIDIACERTRFVIRDLGDVGFWGHAAVHRLTPTPPPEKPVKARRRRKYPKPVVHFDLFGDFGVIVPFTEKENPSQSVARTGSLKGEK